MVSYARNNEGDFQTTNKILKANATTNTKLITKRFLMLYFLATTVAALKQTEITSPNLFRLMVRMITRETQEDSQASTQAQKHQSPFKAALYKLGDSRTGKSENWPSITVISKTPFVPNLKFALVRGPEPTKDCDFEISGDWEVAIAKVTNVDNEQAFVLCLRETGDIRRPEVILRIPTRSIVRDATNTAFYVYGQERYSRPCIMFKFSNNAKFSELHEEANLLEGLKVGQATRLDRSVFAEQRHETQVWQYWHGGRWSGWVTPDDVRNAVVSWQDTYITKNPTSGPFLPGKDFRYYDLKYANYLDDKQAQWSFRTKAGRWSNDMSYNEFIDTGYGSEDVTLFSRKILKSGYVQVTPERFEKVGSGFSKYKNQAAFDEEMQEHRTL